MCSIIAGIIFGIARMIDGGGYVTRGLVLAPLAIGLAYFSQQTWFPYYWWYYLAPIQLVALYAYFFGNLSKDLFQWAQGLPPREPEDHWPAYQVYKLFGNSLTAWACSRLCFGIAPLCILNGVWWAIPIGIIMAYCYRWSFKLRGGSDWVRWAEFASWFILGGVLFL